MRSPEQEEELSQSKGALITRLDVQDFGSIEKAVKAGIYKVGKIIKYFASRLNMSLYYLSDLLRCSDKTVSKIAYALGFEHPSHFTKFLRLRQGNHRWNAGG